MKFEFELTKEDYKNAYMCILKKHSLFAFVYFLILSFLISIFNYIFEENYKLPNYLASYFGILIIVLIAGIIPAYLDYRKSQKIVNSNPDFFGLKSFELTKEGLISSNQNKSSYYKWIDIKRIYKIKNYGFLILKNKNSILFKNDNNELVQKLKEYKKNYSSR